MAFPSQIRPKYIYIRVLLFSIPLPPESSCSCYLFLLTSQQPHKLISHLSACVLLNSHLFASFILTYVSLCLSLLKHILILNSLARARLALTAWICRCHTSRQSPLSPVLLIVSPLSSLSSRCLTLQVLSLLTYEVHLICYLL